MTLNALSPRLTILCKHILEWTFINIYYNASFIWTFYVKPVAIRYSIVEDKRMKNKETHTQT